MTFSKQEGLRLQMSTSLSSHVGKQILSLGTWACESKGVFVPKRPKMSILMKEQEDFVSERDPSYDRNADKDIIFAGSAF